MVKKTVISLMTTAALLTALAPVGVQAGSPAADTAQSVQAAKHADDRVLVKFKQGKQAGQALDKHGLKEFRTLGKGEWKLVKVPKGQAEEFLAKLQGDADVEAVELDNVHTIQLTPPDPGYASQWHLPNIQAPYAWEFTTGSSNNVIAIIDTGVDIQHPDLSSKIVGGYDFVNNDTNADDDQGHGTHCAGIAAASANGINGVGIDWGAKIMPVKVLDANGSGYTSTIIDGVYYAVNNGADVLSMSLGSTSSNSAFQSAIDYAHSQGRIIVAAAGNSATSAKSYPAAYNNVVAVASTTQTNVRTSFSNYGLWVDIAAPGQSIYSTAIGGGMTTMSGTSMATPLVAGVMTLTWSKKMTASHTAVINRVLSTADAISGTGTYWLNGKVNAYKAVNGF